MTTSAARKPSLLIVTLAFAAMLLAANLATPLYAVYARQFGFSTVVLALVFAVYALVLIPALLVFGQLSDRFGRRPVIAMGLGLAVLALVFFAVADGTTWLFATRVVLGVAQGMLSGAATAALVELVDDQPRRAALRATLAQVGGAGAGVLLCGVLAQWAPWPEVLPFAAGMAVCLLVGLGLWWVPETVRHRSDAFRVRTPHVPREVRSAFLRVGLTGAAVWAVAAGLFDQRAEVSAAFYVCIYLGVSIPVIGIGILADLTTLFTAITTFAVVTGTCALTVAAWHLRHRDSETPGTPGHRPDDVGRAIRDLVRGGTR